MKKPGIQVSGLYSHKCHDYSKDDSDVITAVESPSAIEAEPRGKRSGVYARAPSKADELVKLRARCSGGD